MFLLLTLSALGISTNWVSETEVKVLHAKIQQLFFLQRAIDECGNLLYDKNNKICGQMYVLYWNVCE